MGHEAIIDCKAWDAVQAQFSRNAVVRHRNSNAKAPSLLAGMLYDEVGNRMVPSHASKAGRRYRYYVSKPATGNHRMRIPDGVCLRQRSRTPCSTGSVHSCATGSA